MTTERMPAAPTVPIIRVVCDTLHTSITEDCPWCAIDALREEAAGWKAGVEKANAITQRYAAQVQDLATVVKMVHLHLMVRPEHRMPDVDAGLTELVLTAIQRVTPPPLPWDGPGSGL